jgi:penicillin-binding protein 1C
MKLCLAFAIFLIALQPINATALGKLGSFDAVKHAHQPSDLLVLDRHGQEIHRIRTDAAVRRGQWVALGDVSPALRAALVFSEDKRFFEHSGVDWQAVSSAAWGNVWNTKTRGASTITMQLSGLLDEDLQRGAGGRTLTQKIGQTVSATLLEQRWRKDQILEAYLNLVPFRGELVGIDALSRTLFGKAAHGLDFEEAAIAAVLVRAPNAAPAQIAQRACSVLQFLVRQPQTQIQPCVALDLRVAGALQSRGYPASQGFAPHIAQRAALLVRNQATSVKSTLKTNRLQTTLHAPLQRFAIQTLQTHLRELSGRHVQDAAIVVLDNTSGDVLAWVGSSGPLSNAPELDFVTALRQPGSTLKPFLYAQAIAERRLTAASLLDDSDAQIGTASGLYIPQNYDKQFKGWVSVRTALGASLNVPAVRTLVMVTPDAFHKQLRALSLPLLETGDFYGYSLALGSAEVSLLDLTNAYRALGQGGRTGPTRWQLAAKAQPQSSKAAIDPRAAFITAQMLSDPMARARTFGSDSVLNTRHWSAVKTGTSKDLRDNWAIGWSEHYTVGVWVGNANAAPMWDVSGTTGAAPIWAAVMHFLHSARSSRAPHPPPGVVASPVEFGGLEANRIEWFLEGSQQRSFAINSIAQQAINTPASGQFGTKNALQWHFGASGAAAVSARIAAPTTGTIIALDPDIPPRNQRLSLESTAPRVRSLRWQINGKTLASGGRAQWPLWPGRHTIRLLDAKGMLLDEVQIEVRGAGIKARW